jgi:hypothetical protein
LEEVKGGFQVDSIHGVSGFDRAAEEETWCSRRSSGLENERRGRLMGVQVVFQVFHKHATYSG